LTSGQLASLRDDRTESGATYRVQRDSDDVLGYIFFGVVALAFVFWLVEAIRAKIAGRPPSWKQPHEPPPKNSLSNAFWGAGIDVDLRGPLGTRRRNRAPQVPPPKAPPPPLTPPDPHDLVDGSGEH
jgi:hypothetical protein